MVREIRYPARSQGPVPGGNRNAFRERVERREFALVLEIVPPSPANWRARRDILSLIDTVAATDGVAAVAIGDRIRSDDDPDPVEFAQMVADRLGRQPIVHVTGKDRYLADIAAIITRMKRAGLENALLMTGDRIKDRMRERARAVRYVDSVNMIDLFARTAPDCLIGAVVNPFKPVYEDFANQMLKLEKKLRAGAQFIVAQIGFSWRVYRRLLDDCARISPGTPLLATVVYLPLRVARWVHGGRVPGVTLPTEILRRMETDHRDKKARQDCVRRLAIQIMALEALGYTGVHVSAVHTPGTAAALLEDLANLAASHPSREDLLRLWDQYLPNPDTTVQAAWLASPRPSRASGTWRERVRYGVLEFVDRLLFADHSPAAQGVRNLVRRLSASPMGDHLLRRIEHATKKPLVGCQMCGFCRLPHTMYVCPETCPKGLANGPCGGTRDGICEFGDRACVHNQKYRLAAMSGRIRELAEIIIPPVPERLRGSSSWVTHFRGGDPPVRTTSSGAIRGLRKESARGS
jgi:methylenetetrahydrofolate reductase (NADPH)